MAKKKSSKKGSKKTGKKVEKPIVVELSECPMCGLERLSDDAAIYYCTVCSAEGFDCCIAGNGVMCESCVEDEKQQKEDDDDIDLIDLDDIDEDFDDDDFDEDED